jgi:maleylpyruvate isomerase
MNELQRDLRGSIAAHRELEAALTRLGDQHVGAPSLLPGWTVGHVLTHIARNADSFVLLLQAANRGEVGQQYPGGLQQRNADIERGAVRSTDEIVADVLDSNRALEAAYEAMSPVGWQGEGESARGRAAAVELPFRRWREVVVHHADAGLGFTWRDWPSDYVRIELQRMTMLWDSRAPMGLTGLPAPAMAADEHTRLAWLMGRTSIEGIAPAGLMT